MARDGDPCRRAVAVVAYLALVLVPRLYRNLSVPLVFGLATLAVASSITAKPVGTDLWAYQMYGRTVTVHHQNPYDHPPADYPDDPVLARTHGAWDGTRTVYGPVHTGLAVAGAAVTGESELAGRLWWQGLSGASMLGAVGLLLWFGRSRGSTADDGVIDDDLPNRLRQAAALGLNPLVLWDLVHSPTTTR